MLNIRNYRTLVFDCDGVVLNSNHVKTQAFFEAARPYGLQAAQALVDYHVTQGGISRYEKFKYFLTAIVGVECTPAPLQQLLQSFATHVRAGLLSCKVAPGLEDLRRQTPNATWLIVSGGDQQELRQIFATRLLSRHFDGGIFGSPDTKDAILQQQAAQHTLVRPALFLGDSLYDWQAASNAGIDFVFVNAWTEFKDWSSFTTQRNIPSIETVADLAGF